MPLVRRSLSIFLMVFYVTAGARECKIHATIDGWDIYGKGVYLTSKNKSKAKLEWFFKLNPPERHLFKSVRYSQDVLPNLNYQITQRIDQDSREAFVSPKVWPKRVKDFMDNYVAKFVVNEIKGFVVGGFRQLIKHPTRQRVDYLTDAELTRDMKRISGLIPMLILKSNEVQPSVFDVELSMYFKSSNYQTSFEGTTCEF